MQVILPYKLWVTTYNIMTGAATGGGGSWNVMFPKNFTLAGSNDGTTWTLIDSRTGYTSSNNGYNSNYRLNDDWDSGDVRKYHVIQNMCWPIRAW
jgi:hypothetical protein